MTGVRWAVAVGLLVVGTVLTPVTVVARYLRAELLDTDRLGEVAAAGLAVIEVAARLA